MLYKLVYFLGEVIESRLDFNKIFSGLKKLMILCLLSMITTPSMAQEQDDEQQDAEQVLEEVVVTGTRRQNRTVAESVSPIDVLGFADLQSTGYTETNRILSDLLPSFNFPLPSITDGTDHIRPATLRGLAPDHVLVLVNGKRRHSTALLNINGSVGRGSSAVDLNTIPANMIKRIEVLRDGASAQYGSDAIAGVINVILKDRNEGIGVNITYGRYSTKLAGVYLVDSVVAGTNTDGAQLPILTYGDEATRNDGDTITVDANLGFAFAEEQGYSQLGLQWRQRDPTNRSGADTRRQYNFVSGELDSREVDFDRVNHIFGNARVEDISINYNIGYEADDGHIKYYSFGSYSHRNGLGTGFYRRALDSRNVEEIYPDGFLPEITTAIDDFSIALGLEARAKEWNVDLSFVWGVNIIEYGVENSLNASLGVDSPTSFNAGELIYNQQTYNIDANRLLDIDFFASPVSLAIGGELRRENYEIVAGELGSWQTLADASGVPVAAGGSQVFPGFRPTNAGIGERYNVSVYGELDVDVLDPINVIIAGRLESYQDFGTTFNVKGALRYEVGDFLSLRGTVSSGFRAPSLAQINFTTTSTNFINVDGVTVPFEVGTFTVSDPIAQALGAQELQPELAFNVSIGAVLKLPANISVTVDGYLIKIDDRIVLSETLRESNAPGLEELIANAGISDANSARFFINGVDTTTKGLDIVATWKLDVLGGNLSLTGGLNLNSTSIDDIRDNLIPFGEDVELNLFSRREQIRFEKGTPKTKLNVSAQWSNPVWSFLARAVNYGETVDAGTSAAGDEILNPKWIIDVSASYIGPGDTKWSVGVNNLFDTYPDTTPPTSTFNRIFPYSGFSPFGFNGRYVYVRAGLDI